MIHSLNLQAFGGLICFVIGIYLVWLNSQKLLRWPRAQGKVLNVLRLGGVPTPEVEFTAADGVTRTFMAKLPYRQTLKIGATVKVLYNPQAPDEVERVSIIGAIIAPLTFALFGFSQMFCGFLSCR